MIEPRPRGRPPLFDWPRILYEAKRDGDTGSEIAGRLGVPHQTVFDAMKRHKMELRDGRDKRWDGIRRVSDSLRKWLIGKRNFRQNPQ